MARPEFPITRRRAIAGGAALVGTPLIGTAGARASSADASLLALEQQVHAAFDRWLGKLDAFTEAEQAYWDLLDDDRADEAVKDAAFLRQQQASDDADRVGEELDALALTLCGMPAKSIAGLVSKARAVLRLGMTDAADLVLRDLLRFAGGHHG